MIASQANRWLRAVVPGLLISFSVSAQQPVQIGSAEAPNTMTAAASASTTNDIAALKSQLAEQQKQLEQLRATMQKQAEAIEKATKAAETASEQRVNQPASLGEVASTQPILPMPAIVSPVNPVIAEGAQDQPPLKSESPLGFKIGNAIFTPLGFVDFISVTRSTNTGNNLSTNFGGIPYLNATTGGLSEERLSMQNSRIGLRVDEMVQGYKVLGYLETDFLGNQATNVYVTSNSDVLRLRLFFVDLQKDAFEITAGQTWSLITPNRKGIGVLPSDIFYSQDVDTNYQAGLTWARQAGFRVTYNPNDHLHFAVALENPEQYTGSGLTLPKNLATPLANEFDNGSNSTSVPNLFPDVIAKLAFDGGAPGHNAHLEIAGVLSSYRTFNPLTTGPGAGSHFTTAGGGGSVNFSFELARGFRILSNNFITDGAGRYIANTGTPDFIIRADGSPSLVHAGSSVDGFEYQVSPKVLVYAYYGGTYIGRNVALDQDNKTLIGYGYSGSSNSNNHTIQEGTFGLQDVFWKSPQWGSLLLAFQYSYVTRNPWSLNNASQIATHADMGYVDLRYTLP